MVGTVHFKITLSVKLFVIVRSKKFKCLDSLRLEIILGCVPNKIDKLAPNKPKIQTKSSHKRF